MSSFGWPPLLLTLIVSKSSIWWATNHYQTPISTYVCGTSKYQGVSVCLCICVCTSLEYFKKKQNDTDNCNCYFFGKKFEKIFFLVKCSEKYIFEVKCSEMYIFEVKCSRIQIFRWFIFWGDWWQIFLRWFMFLGDSFLGESYGGRFINRFKVLG